MSNVPQVTWLLGTELELRARLSGFQSVLVATVLAWTQAK